MTQPKRRCLTGLIGSIMVLAGVLAGHGTGHAQNKLNDQLGDWRYPESSPMGSHSSGTGSPTQANAYMRTRDDLETVVRYYEKKTGLSLTPGEITHYARSADGTTNIFDDDSKDRPLTLRIFEQHTKANSVMLVISRANGETMTHIQASVVTY
jgi:hypothetical protein